MNEWWLLLFSLKWLNMRRELRASVKDQFQITICLTRIGRKDWRKGIINWEKRTCQASCLSWMMAWRTDKMGIRNKNPVKRGCFSFNLKTQVPTSCFWSWFFVLPFLSLYQPFKNYLALSFLHQASLVAQMVKNLLAMWETWVQSLGWLGRSPREGNGYPLQYSGLENSTDYTAHGVTKSWTQLINCHSLHFLLLNHGPMRIEILFVLFTLTIPVAIVDWSPWEVVSTCL